MPDETFSGLFEETANLDWVTTDGLRRRAGQRRRRQRFAAGAAAAAVVAVVAAGTAFAIDRGPAPEPVPPASPAPSVSPSTDPSSASSPSSGLGSASGTPSGSGGASSSGAAPVIVTEVPLAAMLTAADGGGSGWSRDEDGSSGDWTVSYTFSICPTDGGTYVDDIDNRTIGLSGPNERYVIQSVKAFQSAGAARNYLNWVRGNVNRCASFQVAAQEYKMSVAATGFAGDESFVVKTVGYEAKESYHGFVREGNLVTEYLPSDDTAARATQVGARAAARMCAVTRTC